MSERNSLSAGQLVFGLFWPHLPPSHLLLGSGAGGEGGEAARARFTPPFKGAREGGVSSPASSRPGRWLCHWFLGVAEAPGQQELGEEGGGGRRCGPSCQGLRLPGASARGGQPPPPAPADGNRRVAPLPATSPELGGPAGGPLPASKYSMSTHCVTRPNSGLCGYCTGSCP